MYMKVGKDGGDKTKGEEGGKQKWYGKGKRKRKENERKKKG